MVLQLAGRYGVGEVAGTVMSMQLVSLAVLCCLCNCRHDFKNRSNAIDLFIASQISSKFT